MIRWIAFAVCVVLSLAMLLCGLQIPAHLRAVDASVLLRAGKGTRSLSDETLALMKSDQLGAAQLFVAAAESAGLPNRTKLSDELSEFAKKKPGLETSGGTAKGLAGALLESDHGRPDSGRTEPFTEYIIRTDNRTKALELLSPVPNPLVQSLLQFRSLTNTILFPASSSTSGQALDAAICICGLLAEAGRFSPELSNTLVRLAADADRTGNSEPLEQVLMDLMSLGQRFNWGQLAIFVEAIKNPETLRVLAHHVRRGEGTPVIYAAVCLTGNAAGVAKYLMNFSETGLNDLRSSLKYGAGGVNELLQRNQRLCDSGFCERIASLASSGKIFTLAVDYSWREPMLGLAAKWLLYLLSGFFVAAAFHFARRVTVLEKPLEVRGFHLAREILFALGFLLVVLLMSEPFLSQSNQKGVLPFQLRLPTVGSAVPTGSTGARTSIMNQVTLLTMLLFFVLQALLYVASLVKLAEIRRQRVSSRMKLKLLENEDHLFDAGLYLGFLGTIISLILVSLGVFKQPSLMAAYSSTSFGILFVVLFKVIHLRPTRRRLLLEAETESPIGTTPSAGPTVAAPL